MYVKFFTGDLNRSSGIAAELITGLGCCCPDVAFMEPAKDLHGHVSSGVSKERSLYRSRRTTLVTLQDVYFLRTTYVLELYSIVNANVSWNCLKNLQYSNQIRKY